MMKNNRKFDKAMKRYIKDRQDKIDTYKRTLRDHRIGYVKQTDVLKLILEHNECNEH